MRRRRYSQAFLFIAGSAAMCSCAGSQNALDPAGPHANAVAGVWWLNVAVGIVVYAAVVAVGAWAILRHRVLHAGGQRHEPPDSHPDPRAERTAGIITSLAVGLSVVLLAVLFGADLATGVGIRALENAKDPLEIRLTGHQWWWDVQYEPGAPDQITRTANEIHIPVGKPVRLTLQSADVIHSLWLPNIAGKRDLIPGHPTTLTIQADRPGIFHGQCAEFCGLQHAHMRLLLVAHPQGDFDAWLAHEHADAPEPRTLSQIRGRDIFLSQTCVMCHAISGTKANSRVGPDLTHIASRATLASASVPNTRGFLSGWIVDPQHLKPGARMPSQTLKAEDLQALLDYLESLQ